MKYRVSFYTLSDCHQESEIEATDRATLMAQLDRLMIDLSAPFTIYEIYTGDNKPMTTPTPAPVTSQVQQSAERFREELRADIAEIMDELKSQRAELINVRADLDAIRAGLTQASTATPPTVGAFETMDAVKIIRTKSKGKWYYKMQGGQYMKNGVTIWEEVLDLLNLDPATIAWSDEDTFKLPEPIRVKMLIKTYTDESGIEKQTPQKIAGRA
jgi:hypothetical protein